MPNPQRTSRLALVAAATCAAVVAGVLTTVLPSVATASEAPETPLPTATATAPIESPGPVDATEAPATPAPSAPTETPGPVESDPSEPTGLTLSYAGDSLTAMPYSWMRQLSDPSITNVGGVAINGATSTRILHGATLRQSDVLVIMVGTNDLRYGYSSSSILANIDRIAATVQAKHVLLAAVAPSNITKYGKKRIDRRKQGEVLNRDLQNHALTRGWMFVDPWAADRMLNGGWPKSRTIDGVHPTVAMSKKVSIRMAQAVHIAAEGAKG